MLDLAVLIVNFRTEERVLELLAHLATLGPERPASTIVVDNSPQRGLSRRLAEHPLTPEVLTAPRNLGFAGGVNLGLPLCNESTIVLLNPDAHPEPGCLAGLLAALERRESWAAAPALLPFDDGLPTQPSATRRDPTVLTTLVEHTVLYRLLPRDWLNARYFLLPEAAEEQGDAVSCAMVQGACMAIRRQAFEEVGPFDDDRFFLYWEETDFCRRVRAAGGRILFCPHLRCRHLGGASFDDSALAGQHFWRGLYAYHRKHGGPLRAAFLWCLLFPGMAAEWSILALLDRVRRGRDEKLRRDLSEVKARIGAQLRVLRPPEVPG